VLPSPNSTLREMRLAAKLMGSKGMYSMTHLGEEKEMQVEIERKKIKNQEKCQEKHLDFMASAFLTAAFTPRHRGHMDAGSQSAPLVEGVPSAAQLSVRLHRHCRTALAPALLPAPVSRAPRTPGSQHPSRYLGAGWALAAADGERAAWLAALRTRSGASRASGCSESSSRRTA